MLFYQKAIKIQNMQANLNNTKHSNYLVLGDRICTTEAFLQNFLHPSNIENHLTLSQLFHWSSI